MKYRKLRIAWSVAWGVVCLLLIALWVRSYWRQDSIAIDGTRYSMGIASFGGSIDFVKYDNVFGYRDGSWIIGSEPSYTARVPFVVDKGTWVNPKLYANFVIPHCIPMVIMAALAAIPWVRLRFGLRTLLIGMTVAAIGLGWIVYALR